MARSGQAGGRSNNHMNTGYSSSQRGAGAGRRPNTGSQRGSGAGHRPNPHGRGSGAPQQRSAIRDGQGILGWLGTMARWVVLIILIMVFIKYAHEAYNIGYAVFAEETVAEDGKGEDVTVTITAAMTVREIGTMLEENGLLVDGSVFPYQERFSSYHGDIQPGTYTLSTDMTPTEILKVISEVPEDTVE